jgi:hypothetical protein
MADVRQALLDACTANGWMLSNDVLSKGTHFMRVQDGGAYLSFLAGTGIDDDQALTGAAPQAMRLIGSTQEPIVWPATYAIHVLAAPDEVYVVLNFNLTRYVWLGFGCSPFGAVSTGNWCAAMAGNFQPNYYKLRGAQNTSGGHNGGAFPWKRGDISSGGAVGCIDHAGWQLCDGSPTGISTFEGNPTYLNDLQTSLLTYQPNMWNGEAVLLPIQVYQPLESSKVAYLIEHAHMRYARIDNLDPGQIIQLGADRWVVYPCYQKTTSTNQGAANSSGPYGLAIRYDGP